MMMFFPCYSFFPIGIACEEKLITVEMGNSSAVGRCWDGYELLLKMIPADGINLIISQLTIKIGKTQCQNCKKKCSGEVLRVQDKYFHIQCFKCRVCQNSLAQGGFFCKDGDYYCTRDYQDRFGTKCSHCGLFVEGEVVTALGKTYHSSCFTCARCRSLPFETKFSKKILSSLRLYLLFFQVATHKTRLDVAIRLGAIGVFDLKQHTSFYFISILCQLFLIPSCGFHATS